MTRMIVAIFLVVAACPKRATAAGGTDDPDGGLVLFSDNFNFDAGTTGWISSSPVPNGKAGFHWETSGPGKDKSPCLRYSIVGKPDAANWSPSHYVKSPWFELQGKGNRAKYSSFEQTKAYRLVFLEIQGDPGWKFLASSNAPYDSKQPFETSVWLGLDSHSKNWPVQARLVFFANSLSPDDAKEGWALSFLEVTRQDVPVVNWQCVTEMAGAPAMAEFFGRLYFASVSLDGIARVKSMDAGGRISKFEGLNNGPWQFDPAIPLVLINVKNTALLLFGVSKSGVLCVWMRTIVSGWVGPKALVPEGGVVGRPSVAATGWGPIAETHVVFKYRAASQTWYTRYLRLSANTIVQQFSLAVSCDASSPLLPTIASGSYSASFVGIVAPMPSISKFTFFRMVKNPDWTIVEMKDVPIPAATSASLMYFRDGWSIYYAAPASYNNAVVHVRLAPAVFQSSLLWLTDPVTTTSKKIRTTAPLGAILYSDAPILVLQSLEGEWRYYRLSKEADPAGADYVDGRLIGEEGWRPIATGSAPPALAIFENELFVACRASSVTNGASAMGTSTALTYFLCMSRSIFKARLAALGLTVQHYSGTEAAYPALDVAPHRLSLMTRIGQATWDLPEWLVQTFFGGKPGMAIWIKSWGNGENPAIYLDPGSSIVTIFHELCHWIYGTIMAGDGKGIALFPSKARDSAKELFSEKWMPLGKAWPQDAYPSLTNPPDPAVPSTDDTGDGIPDRFRGFILMYDLTGQGHPWVDCMVGYPYAATSFRSKAKADAVAGFPLLQQKYDWIRENVWNGVEFEK